MSERKLPEGVERDLAIIAERIGFDAGCEDSTCTAFARLRALLEEASNKEANRRCQRLQILKGTVNDQASDEGLWFKAETAPEAYLQRALRVLHAAVENIPDAPEPLPTDLEQLIERFREVDIADQEPPLRAIARLVLADRKALEEKHEQEMKIAVALRVGAVATARRETLEECIALIQEFISTEMIVERIRARFVGEGEQ